MNSAVLAAFAELLAAAGFIYWACEYFVNGVEWVGRKAGVSQNAVGTVLAAFGTALPESVVTFVAVVFGHDAAAKNIGVGAALGGPLVLATVAYPVVGVMLWITRSETARRPIELNWRRLSRDQAWFLAIFLCKIALGFMAFAIKPWLGWLFLLGYAAYTWMEMRHESDAATEGELEPLKFQPKRDDPNVAPAIAQTLLALVVIFAASRVFVTQLTIVGPWLGIPSAVAALLLSPIATELPETMNAIIWIRQGKHRLALANISGAMMIQATIPTALGLFFTPWLFDDSLALAAMVTAVAVLGLLTLLRRNALTPVRLSLFVLFYLVFALVIFRFWQSGRLA
ncbi:MAG: cation:H+ antiporter [Gammaproteobacteria bacterium]|nr:cation:H+ antiporter [Gammaproteobacteria bacterium]